MGRFTLEVLLQGDPTAGWVARSPAVGIWSDMPPSGSAVEEAGAGMLTQAGRRFLLTLPAEVLGFVADGPADGLRERDVEWGQELFRITPRAGKGRRKTGAEPAATATAANSTRDVLIAPNDGVFYSRPTPDAAPFADLGTTVAAGQPIGLIEVMKTFNHVLFEGPGIPASARVLEILVTDGQEVRAGDALLRYEPVA